MDKRKSSHHSELALCCYVSVNILCIWRFSSNTHTHTNTSHVTIFGWIPVLSAPSPSPLPQTYPFFHLSPRSNWHAFCIVFYVSTFFNVRQAHFPSHAQAKARARVCECCLPCRVLAHSIYHLAIEITLCCMIPLVGYNEDRVRTKIERQRVNEKHARVTTATNKIVVAWHFMEYIS